MHVTVFSILTLPKSRCTEEQIIGVLKEGEAGMTVAEICRKHGICDQTYYRWKSKFGGLDVSEARRLRRPFLSDRYIFVTVKVLKPRRHLSEGDFKRLASAMSRMRPKHRFLLTAWAFLPDHGHAVIDPPYPLTISRAMKAR